MSVTVSSNKVQYTLLQPAQVLVIPFYFVEASHIRVVRTRLGVDAVLTTGFSVAGAGVMTGGTLTLDGTQTLGGDRITIKRIVPLTQAIRYVANDRFPASTHERGLDIATMAAQMVEEKAARALVFGEGEVVGSGNVLPAAAGRLRKVLGFDGNGALDLSVSLDDIRTLIIANPVDALSAVTDYGSVGDPVTDVADYGSIA